jgi:hypothetical protein
MEPGGHAHTVGGSYEDRWAARQLLHIMAGEIRSLEREPAGHEGAGVDFWVELPSGVREAQQCKEGKAFASEWSIADLAGEGVLGHLRDRLTSRLAHRFCFVSGLPAPELEALTRSARDSRDPRSFWEQQIQSSRRRQTAFERFCRHLGLQPEAPTDLGFGHDLLSRTRVHLFQDSAEDLRQLRSEARHWVSGDPDQVIDALVRFSRDRLRQRLHLDEVAAFLRDRDLPLRNLAQDPLLAPRIERLQRQFRDSFRSQLVGDHLLPRREADEALLNEGDRRIVILHGVAGSGKSGVLYDLAERLHQAGIPYLPLRLDRQAPRGSPRRFGEDLDLPESPAFCLQAMAGERRGFLLLDQLDALRWTSVHSGEAWEVCRELIREALGFRSIRVVVCCRTYDLEHDPQIRAWAAEAQGAHAIVVGELGARDVARLVTRLGGVYEDLRPTEQSLLTNFFHLSLWGEVLAQTGATPRFSTSRELLGAFWRSRYDALAARGVARDRAVRIVDRLVDFMERDEVLAAPIRVFEASQEEEAAFRSFHILQVDDGKVSFCHQGYLDYLVAQRAMAEIDRGAATVCSWLGIRARQSLFRRERLRLVLGFLRDERPERYLAEVRELLEASEVRFHMKQLVLDSLGQVQDPRPVEIDLVLELLDDESWRPHVLEQIVGTSARWFEALDERGLPAAWLAGQDGTRREAMVTVLRRVSRACGDRVARLLSPYEQIDASWDERCARVLETRAARDSDALFALRLRLAERGLLTGDLVDWNGLASASFPRFVQLLVTAIAAQHEKDARERRIFGLMDAHWPSIGALPLTGVDDEDLRAGFRSLGRSLDLVRPGTGQGLQDALTVETSGLQSTSLETLYKVLKGIATYLMQGGAAGLAGLLHGERLCMPAEVALLDALAEAPQLPEVADLALDWLMAEPVRLRIRFSTNDDPWRFSGRVVAHLSTCCSMGCFERLERHLLDFKEPDLVERYRARHELLMMRYRSGERDTGSHGDLEYLAGPSVSGATPYHLLKQLDPGRRSATARRATQDLERKFADVSPVFFSGWPRFSGGLVRSPISRPEILKRLSDRSWLRLMTNQRLRQPRRPYRSMGQRSIEESSVSSYFSDVRGMASLHPERFARLALQLPATADRRFFEAILGGLGSRGAKRSSGPEEQKEWEPASHETLEALLALPVVRGNECAMDYCGVVQAHRDYPWTDAVLLHVVAIAREHADPRPGHFGVVMERSDDDEEDEHLSTNALNCTRGSAGYTIRDLLFEQPEKLRVLRTAVESLVGDPHPAVRVAAVAACLPVLNIDRQQAISWFLAACELDERILATGEVKDFLRYTFVHDSGRLRPLIERMANSERVQVGRAGAFWVGASHFYGVPDAELEALFARCVAGTSAQRQGIAEVAGVVLRDRAHHTAAKAMVQDLANDPNREVHQRIMDGFSQTDLELFEPSDPFLVAFAASEAFKSNPSPLLWKLEKHTAPLLDFAPCLLQVGRTFANDLVATSPRYQFAPGVHLLVPLLLRLYADSWRSPDHQSLHQECLDLWDLLLDRRVTSAAELTEELGKL